MSRTCLDLTIFELELTIFRRRQLLPTLPNVRLRRYHHAAITEHDSTSTSGELIRYMQLQRQGRSSTDG